MLTGIFNASLKKVMSRALWTGVVASGLSYFLLDRSDLVEIFGQRIPHWVAEAIVVAVGSLGGDIVSFKIFPWIASKLINSPNAIAFLKLTAGPAAAGGAAIGFHELMVREGRFSEYDRMTEFLLAVGSKLAGDAISDSNILF